MVKNSLEHSEIQSQSPFLTQPKLIEWFGSYYPEALECGGEKYVIHKEPIESFYKNGKYFVKVVQVEEWLEYGKERKYRYMIFDNGKITPFKEWITQSQSWNRIKEYNQKYPLIETQENGYMKYDENLSCSPLEWMPEWRHASRLHFDEWTIELYYNDYTKQKSSMIYTIDKNYAVSPIPGTPKGAYLHSIDADMVAKILHNGKEEQYFYDQKKKIVAPFIFEWFEWKSYEIDFIHTDDKLITITS